MRRIDVVFLACGLGCASAGGGKGGKGSDAASGADAPAPVGAADAAGAPADTTPASDDAAAAAPGPWANFGGEPGLFGQDAAGPSDADLCAYACERYTFCDSGVGTEAECRASCAGAPIFLACLRETAGFPGSCNVLAYCTFAGVCNGRKPSGTGSCADAQACEGSCTRANSGPDCACGCVEALSPDLSVNLLINNVCAQRLCAAECASGGQGCLECFDTRCQDQDFQCSSM